MLSLRHIFTEVVKCSETLNLFVPHTDIESKDISVAVLHQYWPNLTESYALNVMCPNTSEPIAWPQNSSDLTQLLFFMWGYVERLSRSRKPGL